VVVVVLPALSVAVTVKLLVPVEQVSIRLAVGDRAGADGNRARDRAWLR
jgi:hypothetical protein